MNKKKLGLSLLLLLSAPCIYAQSWEHVGSPGAVSAAGSSYNNLVIDADGNYYLSYYDVSVTKGSVQKFDGTSWTYLGGSPGVTSGIATYNSLSVDQEGNVYYTNQAGWPAMGMQVRKYDGETWVSLPDAASSTINYHASAVSSDQTLYIFSGVASGTVSKYVDGSWVQVGLNGFSGGATFAEMVIDSDDYVYVLVVNSGSAQVYKISGDADSDGAWELLGGAGAGAASGSEQYTSDIALDADNNVYVSYVSNSAGGRKANVKKFDGESWITIGEENFTEESVQHMALTVTPAGVPYIVSSRWEDDDFLYNSVYRFEYETSEWNRIGGIYVHEGDSKYNDIAVDPIGGYVVVAFSSLSGTVVKRISADTEPPVTVMVDSVVIKIVGDVDAVIDVAGGALPLSADVFPAEAIQDVLWSVTDGETYGWVDENGIVTALANGIVVVRATSVDDPAKYDEIEVVIMNQEIFDIESVIVSTEGDVPAEISTLGGSLGLLASITPAEADQSVLWSIVSGSGLATLDDMGVVTALADGIVKVRATSVVNGSMYGEIDVNISNQLPSAVDKHNVRHFIIYPNPSQDKIFIQNGEHTIVSVSVHNYLGQKLKDVDPADIDLSMFMSGIYLLYITDSEEILTIVKVVKE